jgi:nuclear transport factor 2 (NTF2) superfamily protein
VAFFYKIRTAHFQLLLVWLCSTFFRSYNNENWQFDANGLIELRYASINDLPITEGERKFHWPLGRRPDEHTSLSELGVVGFTS